MLSSILLVFFLVLLVGILMWAFLAEEWRAGARRDWLRISGRERISCQFCGHIYEDVPIEDLSKCPVCGSINKVLREEMEKMKKSSREDDKGSPSSSGEKTT